MTNITVQELKQRMDEGEELHLVDVREPHEREEFSIGGVHLPLGKIQNMDVEEIEGLKNEEIICYCRSGNRSGMAAMILEQLGFVNTKNLVGGMLAWQDKISK
jgi:rhodanese-related sulfurtransferase